MNKSAVTLQHVDFAYESHTIFKEVTCHIPQKQFHAVIGENGVGKTTLLRLLLGELSVQKGEIKIFGLSIDQAIKQQKIAYISQQSLANYRQFPTSVEEVLDIHLQFLNKKQEKQRYLETVDLQNHANKRLDELSGGQLQRLAIALALIQEAPLILLDEPTNNIDARFTKELYALLAKFVQEGKTVIIVTHHIQDALPFVDTVIEVSDCRCKAVDKVHFHINERQVSAC